MLEYVSGRRRNIRGAVMEWGCCVFEYVPGRNRSTCSGCLDGSGVEGEGFFGRVGGI